MLGPRSLRTLLASPLLAGLALGCGEGSARSTSERTDAGPALQDAETTMHEAGALSEAAAPIHTDVCNGHAELCDRRYDQVAFPGTHGSYSASSEGFLAPDQTYAVARQLAAGVRVLHFELHIYKEDVYACHALCLLGSKRFVDELHAVHAFLLAHPFEVVTLLLERSDAMITADDIGAAMVASGLRSFTHVQAVGAPWPTLRSVIDSGERLVALLDDPSGSSYPFLLPRWQLTWETPWDNQTPTDFGRCHADRGKAGDGVYVVDTYLEDQPIPSVEHAALVNYDPFLVTRLLYCQRATKTFPNFVMVNFYDASDLFSVVDVLNGFAPKPDVDLSAFPPSAWPVDGGVVGSGPREAGTALDAKTPPLDGSGDAGGNLARMNDGSAD